MEAKLHGGKTRREQRTAARQAVVEAVWEDIRASIAKKPPRRLIFYPSVTRVVQGYNSGDLKLSSDVSETFPRLAVSTVVNWFENALADGDQSLIDKWGRQAESGHENR